ncbi:MAG TPA: glycosyltransferase family 2 protein, partial [Mucilaginibacter sp.]
ETLEAIQGITYPHQTYLCDEADDPYLKDICQKLGVHHVTRKEKIDAKAGNINNALRQSTGELCVVLDPDHVPFPDFLDPIVDHFNNPEIGYVQIVQAYFNQDQGWIAKGAAQQTYQYYGPMMMTMNAYGTAQAIGANCTFRRTALESIGGHAAGLAEDMHTSMQLHAKGWKSVYVPAVQARGLVPATLSAYYKQQLKWSRGVFELLVTSYVKLFWKFTWRQKLHYGLIPMFYLSGFVYLINFIIPIASLFADVYPLRMDFSAFTIVCLPFITSVVLIRHYAQRWVMEDNERGFHIIGGLLLIGTWWVFIIGFIYTIIRKKVPYIPTPKDISDERNFRINLPNICVLVISVIAIAYGLHNDWNPFTFVMAAICGINCLFMVFMLVASEQFRVRSYQQRHKSLLTVSDNINSFKKRFWLFRRRLYSGIRSVSLMLIVLSVCFSIYIINRSQKEYTRPVITDHKNIFLVGLFDPTSADDMSTPIKVINAYQGKYKKHLDIVPYYIPWGDQSNCYIPKATMAGVYKNNSVPMITWEPRQNLFNQQTTKNAGDKHVFANILAGVYDQYINTIAIQVRDLNRPVFLRFAHEPDNPLRPWSERSGNNAEDYKAAWKYVHNLFINNHAYNAVWVWNPWKPDSTLKYFPGKKYVDWIGVTALNYDYDSKGKSGTFAQFYNPFHKLSLMDMDLPVMITEMGAVKPETAQIKWLTTGIYDIYKYFPEIKGVVLFNSAFGKNAAGETAPTANWKINELSSVAISLPGKITLNGPAAGKVKLNPGQQLKNPGSLDALRGVIYLKGQNWYGNTYVLTKKTISTDFADIKNSGANTIRIYGPGVYDRTTFNVAAERGLKIQYSFWMPDPKAFIDDNTYLAQLAGNIKQAVKKYKGNQNIVNWNIGNCTIQQLAGYYLKPELFYRQQNYINWLKQLVHDIKKIDPSRVVTVDAEVSASLKATVGRLHDEIPEIDAFGLVLTKNLQDTAQIKELTAPHYFSSVEPAQYFELKVAGGGVFMKNWQDQQTASGVSFDGLKDIWGRNKPGYYQLLKHWKGYNVDHQLPDIKILRPSLTTVPGEVLPYYALVYNNDNWHLAEYLPTGLRFEWYQVKTDSWGYPVELKLLNKGAYLNYTVPDNPSFYRLYLVATKGNDVTTASSILNIPLNDSITHENN